MKIFKHYTWKAIGAYLLIFALPVLIAIANTVRLAGAMSRKIDDIKTQKIVKEIRKENFTEKEIIKIESALPKHIQEYINAVEIMDDKNMTFNAAHCTDWSKKAANYAGRSYNKRDFNGWKKLSGPALLEEQATKEVLDSIKPGMMIEFVNNNGINGRHSGIVVSGNTGDYPNYIFDTISFCGSAACRDPITRKSYTFHARGSDEFSKEKNSLGPLPIIATYKLK